MTYTIDALQEEYRQGKHAKFLFFWGHTPPAAGAVGASCLSQWWMQDFTVDGVRYSCAEQYMMAEKARLFGDGERLARILQAKHPKEMKAHGRAVRGFDNTVWESRCYDIVKAANRAKFTQNPDLLQFLLGTGSRILVEASPRDRVWGIGMGAANPAAHDPLRWRGRNLLGFALTEVRDELRAEGTGAT